jgi:chromosome segregation protein
MYLKKLEMVGFKSFVDRQEFVFDAGVTGIVGPNGCGKSNVVDAFKWILGEQSAKGLRGSEMKDVIFNGTQSRKPGGYAEVTASFDNSDRFFDIEFDEVAITRQLYRSGESKYMLNRTECRLRDIRTMLMGTGIGASSYSIFEQGKIDVFLQASPQDRRIILEEAAGISKYRARKAESLRGLQRVEDNLARLGDVLSELERRRHRVKIQAGKARHYREYSDRLRELRVRLAVEDYRASMTERAELTYRKFFLDFEIERLDDTLARLRVGLEEYSAERREKAESLAGLRDRLTEVRTRRERTEESIHHNRRRLGELEIELESKSEDLTHTRRSLDAEREQLQREEDDMARLRSELEECRKTLKEHQEKLLGVREEHEELRETIEGQKRQLVGFMEEESRVSNKVTQIESDLGNFESRRVRLVEQIETVQVELAEAQSQSTELATELHAHREEAARIETARSEVQAEIQELERSRDETSGHLKRLHGELQGCQSRLDVLQSFEDNLEGISQGVQEVLRGQADRPGVHDLFAHLVEVDSQYAAAVDAVLSTRSQALVVESEDGALELLNEIRESSSGALEILPLERAAPVERMELEGVPGVVGLLRDFVTCPAEYEDLFDKVFAGVVLIADFDTAVRLSRNGLGRTKLVTLAGEIVDPCGSFAIPGELTMGLVSRRSEMQDLAKQVDDLQAEAQTHETVLSELEQQLEEREARFESLNIDKDNALRQVTSVESRLEQMRKEEERLLRVVQVTQSEIAEIDAEVSRCGHEKAELAARVEELVTHRETLTQQSGESEARLVEHGKQVHYAAELLTESRVALAEFIKREEGLSKSIEQMRLSIEEREERFATLESQIEGVEERLSTTRSDIEGAESSLVGIREQEQSCQEEVSGLESEDRRLGGIEDAFRDEIDRLRTEQSDKAMQREKVNLEDREGVLRRNAALEKVHDEYGLDLIEIMDRLGKETDAEGEAADAEGDAEAADAENDVGEERLADANADSDADSDADASKEGTENFEVVAVVPTEVSTDGETKTDPPAAQTEDEMEEADALGGGVPTAPSADLASVEELIRGWIQGSGEWDRAAAVEEIKVLTGKIRRLGNVNLDALEELEEIEERLTFQVDQREDLVKAQRDLMQIISEINKTSREYFSKTFDEVQANFRQLFEKCFGGGRADLVLEEGVDILEAGVEIVARPPGKKLTSLSLMSGGEKTMTTIALMFAIFRARPSPFCILDEVDAPLDESNVRRFVVLLADFVENSQFIIVTHNKITMAETDRLYGVTMQEKGVSKRVAVEFENYDPDNPESISTADIDQAPVRK